MAIVIALPRRGDREHGRESPSRPGRDRDLRAVVANLEHIDVTDVGVSRGPFCLVALGVSREQGRHAVLPLTEAQEQLYRIRVRLAAHLTFWPEHPEREGSRPDRVTERHLVGVAPREPPRLVDEPS